MVDVMVDVMVAVSMDTQASSRQSDAAEPRGFG